MAAYVLANAGLKVCLIEAGPNYDPAINSSQLKKIRGSRQGVEPAPGFALLVILMQASGGGILMGNLTPMQPAISRSGGVQEWWEAVPITGEEFHYGLAPMILK